jgi:transaldolase
MELERVTLNESAFRWTLNQDAMATEKLAEGIRGFADDLESLSRFLNTLC